MRIMASAFADLIVEGSDCAKAVAKCVCESQESQRNVSMRSLFTNSFVKRRFVDCFTLGMPNA